MYEEITFEIDDPVATITLNRPEKLNALTTWMRREMMQAIGEAEASPAVVGIILTGAGRAFSAGADMTELGKIQQSGIIPKDNANPAKMPGDRSLGDDFTEGYSVLLSVRKPLIAAINGPCAGLGFSIAMFCDLRFASDRAAFVPSFSKLGLVSEHGTSWVLPRLIGSAKTLDIVWSSRRIDAEEALRLGLVERVFEQDRLLDETKAYIRRMAETTSPTALMEIKHQIYRHMMLPLGEAMADTNRLMDASVLRPDFKEGLAAFLEKRQPKFERVQVD